MESISDLGRELSRSEFWKYIQPSKGGVARIIAFRPSKACSFKVTYPNALADELWCGDTEEHLVDSLPDERVYFFEERADDSAVEESNPDVCRAKFDLGSLLAPPRDPVIRNGGLPGVIPPGSIGHHGDRGPGRRRWGQGRGIEHDVAADDADVIDPGEEHAIDLLIEDGPVSTAGSDQAPGMIAMGETNSPPLTRGEIKGFHAIS